jgi:ankyrin repeat protein
MLKLLLENGADVNIQDIDGDTVLLNACACGDAQAVKLFLTNGADVNFKNYLGLTALMRTKNNNKILNILLENFADVNAQDNSGDKVLSKACTTGYANVKIVKLLLDYGADASIRNNQGLTAFMRTKDTYKVIKALLIEHETVTTYAL